MAIKVFGVRGPRAIEKDGRDDQDFLLIDSESFFARDVKAELALLTALAKGPDGMKQFAKDDPDTEKRFTDSFKKAPPSPLTVSYFSAVPYKLGDRAVKYAAQPASGNGPGIDKPSSPGYLREAMLERLSEGKPDVIYDLSIVPQTDALTMPIEDPTVNWKATPVRVATVKIAPQKFDTRK